MRLLTVPLSLNPGGHVKRTRTSRLAWSLPLAAGALVAGTAACGGNGASSSSSFDSGTGNHDGGHDATTDGGGGDTGLLNQPDSNGDVGTPDACAATSQTANTLPLDMYILLDRSGSMADNDSWTQEVNALSAFLGDFRSKGLGVGLQYLPLLDLCDPSAYSTPAVPINTLPTGAGQLVTSLAASRPFGGTPLVPALEGAVQFAQARQVAHPDRDIVIVLSSDGLPDNSCSLATDGGLPNTTQNAVAVLQAAASAVPPVKTFVIGIADVPDLNLLAAAGGTGNAILIGGGDAGTVVPIEAPLIAAFNQIRTTALPCTYKIPPSTTGGMIDFGAVNVTFTPGSSSAQPFYGVANAAACTTTSSDWYYDDPANPKNIELCPTACTEVKAATVGTVSVAFGCTTIGPPK
jgi:hypothetical protein